MNDNYIPLDSDEPSENRRPPASNTEKLILIPAVVFATLVDRLFIEHFFTDHLPFFSAILMLCAVLYLVGTSYKRILKSVYLSVLTVVIILLCVWNFLFDYNSVFGWLSLFVIPVTGMYAVILTYSGHELKHAGRLFLSTLGGFFVKPFSRVDRCFTALGGLLSTGKNKLILRICIGLLVSAFLLALILPLLAGADMVFGYYLSQLTLEFSVGKTVWHFIVICVSAILIYSLLWNLKHHAAAPPQSAHTRPLDHFIVSFALITISIVYAFFCAVQFGYLFAGAGLPGDLTYSAYAREGFWQLIMVSGINLCLFGIAGRFSVRTKLLTVLRLLMQVFTSVMIISGMIRLCLYISAYGLTWLRLISFWFICYLAMLVLLCLVKMIRDSLPVLAVSFLTLTIWFACLGYVNPDALIVRINTKNESVTDWAYENKWMIRSELSLDAFNAMKELGFDEAYRNEYSFDREGYSLPYYRQSKQ